MVVNNEALGVRNSVTRIQISLPLSVKPSSLAFQNAFCMLLLMIIFCSLERVALMSMINGMVINCVNEMLRVMVIERAQLLTSYRN